MQGVPMKVFASEIVRGAGSGFAAPPSLSSELPMLLSATAGLRRPSLKSPAKADLKSVLREFKAPGQESASVAPRKLPQLSLRPPPGLDLADDGFYTPSVATPSGAPSSVATPSGPPALLDMAEGFRTPSVATASEHSGGSDAEESTREWRTTLHVRNLPCYFSRDAFLELIDAQGLCGQYDFVYLPMDFKTKQSMGYAFVNFLSSTAALLFQAAMNGFRSWPIHSHKVCSVQWSQTQGYDKNIKVVRKSDVMKKSGVPEEFKPTVFVDGATVPFPDPPQKLRPGPKCLQLQPAMASYAYAQHF